MVSAAGGREGPGRAGGAAAAAGLGGEGASRRAHCVRGAGEGPGPALRLSGERRPPGTGRLRQNGEGRRAGGARWRGGGAVWGFGGRGAWVGGEEEGSGGGAALGDEVR